MHKSKSFQNSEQIITQNHSFAIADVFKYGSIEKALIMKEIKGMSLYKIRHDKSPWIYYSSSALAEKFPYMKSASIKRWLRELKNTGFLETKIENKVKYDRTKSYLSVEIKKMVTNNDAPLGKMTHVMGHNDPSKGQNDLSKGQIDPTIPSQSPSLTNSSCPSHSSLCAKAENDPLTPEIVFPSSVDQKKEPLDFSFEKFWQAYPKKRSRGQAEKAFKKLNPDQQLLDHILTKIEELKQSKNWRRLKGKYIPYPATWLNAQGWKDKIETEVDPLDPLDELEPRTVSDAKWLDGQRQAKFLLEEDQDKIRRSYNGNN